MPSGVSTVTFTRAARACDQRTSVRPPVLRTTTRAGETRSDPSVEFTAKRRVVVDDSPCSSVAATVSVHLPSAGATGSGSEGGWPSGGGGDATVGGKATSYAPGSRAMPASCHAIVPPGAVSVAVTVDGRTTLYESRCSSATPSPFGETTASSGG